MDHQCCQETHAGFIHGSASCSSLELCSFCCWMDVDEAPAHVLACPKPSLRRPTAASPAEQAAVAARQHTPFASNKASAPPTQPHKLRNSVDCCSLQHLGLPQLWAGAQGQTADRSASLQAYSAAAGAAASVGGCAFVPQGSYSSPACSMSRHQALLELWHILRKLRASSACMDTVPLPTVLSASQTAIQCVNSSMHVVRAALSAADVQLADRAMDVATMAVQHASERLQAATRLAAQDMLLSQQQQWQLLQRQMRGMQHGESDLEDTCCSKFRC